MLAVTQLIIFGGTSSAVSAPLAPTLTLLSAPSVNTPLFSGVFPDLQLADVARFQRATDSGFATAVDTTTAVDAGILAAGEIDFSTGPLADGSWFFRIRIERGAAISAWSNVVTETIATAANTWNPSDKSASLTLSNGNLTYTGAGSGTFNNVRAVASASSGKKYWETVATTEGIPGATNQGFGNSSATLTSASASIGDTADSLGWQGSGAIREGGGTIVVIQGWTQGDTLCFALDLTNSKIWFRTNGGNWNNDVIANQNPATNTGGQSISGMNPGPYFAMGGTIVTGDVYTTNFGATAYAQAPPSGFGNW